MKNFFDDELFNSSMYDTDIEVADILTSVNKELYLKEMFKWEYKYALEWSEGYNKAMLFTRVVKGKELPTLVFINDKDEIQVCNIASTRYSIKGTGFSNEIYTDLTKNPEVEEIYISLIDFTNEDTILETLIKRIKYESANKFAAKTSRGYMGYSDKHVKYCKTFIKSISKENYKGMVYFK